MSIFRKILMVLICILAAGISTWLRYGDVETVRQWLSNRPPSIVNSVSAPVSQEEDLPIHLSYAGSDAAARDSVLVLHFRRPDTRDETMARVAVKVFDGDGALQKEVSVWGVFRHDMSLGASVARFTIGTFPPGTYRIEADLGSRQALGVKRAAIEFASLEDGPNWADLVKTK